MPEAGLEGEGVGRGLWELLRWWPARRLARGLRLRPSRALTYALFSLPASPMLDFYFLCLAVHRLAPKSKLIHAYNMEDLGVCHFNGQEYT